MSGSAIRTREAPLCRLCGSTGRLVYTDLQDRLYGLPGNWGLRRCVDSKCGLAWVDPAPVETDLGRLYESYFTHTDDPAFQGEGSNLPYTRLQFRKAFDMLLKAISVFGERRRVSRMYLDGRAPGELLEVGCGDGGKLAMLRALGWHVMGQEFDESAAKSARSRHGLDVRADGLDELIREGLTFDAVISNHVLEHVSDPVGFLENCYRMLKPGGRLTIVTPNVDSYGHRTFGRSSLSLDPPRHLFLFSPISLKLVAAQAGLAQARVHTTCANAQIFAIGSLDIRKRGRHVVGSLPPLGVEAAAMITQLKAFRAFRSDPLSGEECVLICDK